MKKFVLGLFLILGVVAFSAPNRVDVKKIEAKGYAVSQDSSDTFVYEKNSKGEILSVGYYLIPNENPQEVAISFVESSKENLGQAFKFLEGIETKKVYISKFLGENNSYAYSIVGKNQKVKDYYILILHATNKDISGDKLSKLAESLLVEAESYLK